MDAQMRDNITGLLEAGKTEEASALCARLRETDADDVRTWILTAAVYEAQGNQEAERDAIAEGLKINQHHFELYYMLGILYGYRNVNQAYLCMEQAAFYLGQSVRVPFADADAVFAGGSEEERDLAEIRSAMEKLRARPGFHVRGTSFLIVSYNDMALTQKCIGAIRGEMPRGTYEIVVVDNHSTDGVAEWLRDQEDIRLIENGENVGFPLAVNIAYRACEKENDVFLLNNDAVPAEGALFWLRMGLYEDMNVGAVSAMSNNASLQTEEDAPDTFEACMDYGKARNVPCRNPYEARCRFTGFAILLKQDAHMAVRMGQELLDDRFSPGYFEDDDLGIRVAAAGYRQLLCHNAFIYHRGGSGFSASKETDLSKRRAAFIEKWGFDIWAFAAAPDDVLDAVTRAHDAPVRALVLDAGMGAVPAALQYRFPCGRFAGIEQNPVIAGLGARAADIICGDPETMPFPWPEHFFDFILASDVLARARDADALREKLARYLADGGRLITV